MSTAFYLAFAALWILVIVHSLILLGLVRLVYQLQQAGAAAGSGDISSKSGREAPRFGATDLSGAPIGSADFAGQLTALLFVSPDCPSCTATLSEMEALSHKAQGNVIVICRAGREDCARLAARHRLTVPTVADEDERISRLFEIPGVPTAVLINENNHIQSYGQPMRGEELKEMLEQATQAEAVRVD